MAEISRKVEMFLRNAESCGVDCNDLRNTIVSHSLPENISAQLADKLYRSFRRECDVYCPVDEDEEYCMKALLQESKVGRWSTIPDEIVASILIDPSDIWVMARLPQVITNADNVIKEVVDLIKSSSHDEAASAAKNLAALNVDDDYELLGWRLLIPFGKSQEVEFVETARIVQVDDAPEEGVVDKGLGCFGLCANAFNCYESRMGHYSLPLCIQATGTFSMIGCDCEIYPSSVFRRIGFSPMHSNPLIWTDADKREAARFERLLFPIDSDYGREPYYRQPQLWRWVCNRRSLEKATEQFNVRVYKALSAVEANDPLEDNRLEQRRKETALPFD
jgi:hypothetical protein